MASTNFRVFNEANTPANTYNDSEYQNATQRQTGVIPGMALSRMHNKMYFQWSSMATAIAQYLVSRGYDCNDNDIAGIVSALENSCGLNIRQDSTEYAVGDIAYSAALSPVLFLECTTPGTTASSIPGSLTGAAEGDSITDGTVVWIVRKIASMADVRAASPGQRQANTIYEVDAMASLGILPYGWYLECTTEGTTSASDLVITSPAIGDTVTDGTVVWTIRKIGSGEDLTVVDSIAPTSNQGPVAEIINGVANMLKQIKGDSDWKTTPVISLASILNSLGTNFEVTTDETTGAFSVPALGITGLMAQNGYISLGRLFGGLILQWGYSSAGPFTSLYTGTFAFPIVFPHNSLSAVGYCGSETATPNVLGAAVPARNATHIKVQNTGSVTTWVGYIAFGY